MGFENFGRYAPNDSQQGRLLKSDCAFPYFCLRRGDALKSQCVATRQRVKSEMRTSKECLVNQGLKPAHWDAALSEAGEAHLRLGIALPAVILQTATACEISLSVFAL
jgi:hypothetical protein